MRLMCVFAWTRAPNSREYFLEAHGGVCNCYSDRPRVLIRISRALGDSVAEICEYSGRWLFGCLIENFFEAIPDPGNNEDNNNWRRRLYWLQCSEQASGERARGSRN